MRLDVGVLGPEELLRAVDGELLDHVDVLAAAVVAPAGVALGVLVGQHAADGLHHRRAGVVLAGDHLQPVLLALGLGAQQARDGRVDLGDVLREVAVVVDELTTSPGCPFLRPCGTPHSERDTPRPRRERPQRRRSTAVPDPGRAPAPGARAPGPTSRRFTTAEAVPGQRTAVDGGPPRAVAAAPRPGAPGRAPGFVGAGRDQEDRARAIGPLHPGRPHAHRARPRPRTRRRSAPPDRARGRSPVPGRSARGGRPGRASRGASASSSSSAGTRSTWQGCARGRPFSACRARSPPPRCRAPWRARTPCPWGP